MFKFFDAGMRVVQHNIIGHGQARFPRRLSRHDTPNSLRRQPAAGLDPCHLGCGIAINYANAINLIPPTARFNQ